MCNSQLEKRSAKNLCVALDPMGSDFSFAADGAEKPATTFQWVGPQ
jgi:hypothetical protein